MQLGRLHAQHRTNVQMASLTNSHRASSVMVANHALDPIKSCFAARSLVLTGIANGTWGPVVHLTAKVRALNRTLLSQLRQKVAREVRKLSAAPELPVRISLVGSI